MSTLITARQVLETAKAVVEENPDAINPREWGDSGMCRYVRDDGVDNPPNAALNCLGGAILLRLGKALPAERNPVQSTSSQDDFDDNALALLGYIQSFADAPIRPGVSRTWADALPLAVEEYNSNHEDDPLA